MIRHLLLAALLLATIVLPAMSAPIQLIDGLPSSYVPGQPITFDVRLPLITNLGSYNIDVVLESDTGIAGTNFVFDVAATVPAATSYVFPSSAYFVDAANVDSSMRHRITLTDFDFAGVDVLPGTNDHVANVVIQTSPNFTGRLNLFVDAESLILDMPDVDPTPVLGFDAIQAGVAEAATIVVEAVPEPPTTWLLVVGFAGFGVRLRPRFEIALLIRT
jgi:hypothetical protein